MLQPEITPFGEAHITNLKETQLIVEQFLNIPNLTADQVAQIKDVDERLRSGMRGFTRFMVCAEDEWKQKTRYEKYAKENGYKRS